MSTFLMFQPLIFCNHLCLELFDRLINLDGFLIKKDRTFAALIRGLKQQDTKSLKRIYFMTELISIATQIRRDIVRMVHGATSGHPGGSLGCTDYLTALYFKIMKHNPAFDINSPS